MRRSLLLLFFVPVALFAQTAQLDSVYSSIESRLMNNVIDDKTIAGCKRFYDLCRAPECQNTSRYAEVLTVLARVKNRENDVDAAISLSERSIEIRRSVVGMEPLFLAESLNELGVYHSRKGNYESAILAGEEAEKIFRETYGTKQRFYGVILCNLSVYYSARRSVKDDLKAVEMAEKSLKLLDKKTENYVNTLSSLSVYYSRIGNYKKSEAVCTKALAMGRKVFGKASSVYAGTLQNLANNSAKANNPKQAILYANEAKTIFENIGQNNTMAYARLLYSLALYNENVESYEAMAPLLVAANNVFKAVEGECSVNALLCVSKLAEIYNKTGELDKALYYTNLSEDIKPQSQASDVNWGYAHALSEQGVAYAASGNYSKAIELEQSAKEIYTRLDRHEDVVSSINILSHYYANSGDNDRAIEVAQEALKMAGELADGKALMPQIYNNLSTYYYKENRNDQAVESIELALKHLEEMGDTVSSEFAKVLSNHALMRYVTGDAVAAISQARRAIAIHTDIFGENHPDNAMLFYNLAAYYQKTDSIALSRDYFFRALHLQMNYVRANFSHFTTEEREHFWAVNNGVLGKTFDYALLEPNDEAAWRAYDVCLFTKGLLLNSEVDFRKLLLASKDEELIQDYNKIAALRKEINDNYRAKEISENVKQSIRQREHEMAKIERRLIKNCKEYGDFTANLSIASSAVRKALSEGDVAIEFATASLEGGGKAYMAICMKYDWDAPKIVRIFDSEQLDTLQFGNLPFKSALQQPDFIPHVYNSLKVGQLVWKPLMEALGENVRNIYFSPVGILHQLAIEYLYCDEGKRVFDDIELHRLSSTKLLTQRQNVLHKIQKAVVYGGLHYSLSSEDLIADNNRYCLNDGEQPMRGGDMQAIDSLTREGLFKVHYLPGTLSEAEYVAEQLMQHEIPTTVFLGEEGTEASFKALTNSETNILHIATHGFFLNAESIKQNNERFLFLQEDIVGDNSLNSAGLLFSGSNLVLSGGQVPVSVENGVLTAKEISRLDFRNLNLVVLSACQTGLGEIRDDGVFGLQRGFKKAGAQSLLLSLWNVSDAATELMMETFYAEYLSGVPAGSALLQAQKKLRENGYLSPYYWASFVLLDGF